jgi:3-oxoacyl-(acyl-carrier-protein) synthase
MAVTDECIVITGIGVITSIGRGRESVWRAVQRGDCGVKRLTGLPGIPDGMLLGASVDVDGEFPGQLKNIPLCRQTAAEALADARNASIFNRSIAIGSLVPSALTWATPATSSRGSEFKAP